MMIKDHEALRAFLIHLVVPIIGIAVFIELRRRMLLDKIERPPIVSFFIIFAHYGAVLIGLLTILFWYISGMAMLGAIYLPTGGLIVMGILAVVTFSEHKLSNYHRVAFLSAALYPAFSLILLIGVAIYKLLARPHVE